MSQHKELVEKLRAKIAQDPLSLTEAEMAIVLADDEEASEETKK